MRPIRGGPTMRPGIGREIEISRDIMQSVVKFTLILLLLGAATCECQWVWTEESGWINSRYDPRAGAQNAYNLAQDHIKKGERQRALELLVEVARQYPNTPEGKESLYLAAQCLYANGDYYEAHLYQKKHLEKYPATPHLAEVLVREFDIGKQLLEGKGKDQTTLLVFSSSSAELGLEVLKELIQRAPYAPFSDEAQLLIANYHFDNLEFFEAQQAYLQLFETYSKSEWRPLAQYRMAMCSLLQFRDLPYDREPLLSAQKKVDEYFRLYPQSQETPLGKRVMKAREAIREKLAQREFLVAQYYLGDGEVVSCRIYLHTILREYGDTNMAESCRNLLKRLDAEE